MMIVSRLLEKKYGFLFRCCKNVLINPRKISFLSKTTSHIIFNIGKDFDVFCFMIRKIQLLNILANEEYTNC